MAETIAIAEDEADLREAVAEFLQAKGYRVLATGNANEFRRQTQFESIDLALLDINMPGEDGLSLARWIRSRNAGGIIFATAAVAPVDRIVGLEVGADDYVTKPYDLRELLARIRSILRRNKASGLAANGRRLAAIASIDLVGYTRLIHEDEDATIAMTDHLFREFALPILEKGSGRIFKMLGDGALIEFASVQDSVEWAIRFQADVAAMASSPRGGAVKFRIGISAGDIVVRNEDRFGETVALAVRIQEQCPHGGVLLSHSVYAMLRDRARATFRSIGEKTLKNVPQPAQLFVHDPATGTAAEIAS
jgi:DNA-binding response OmpR family regulator